jgi:amino acid adenylation domain-containing protein
VRPGDAAGEARGPGDPAAERRALLRRLLDAEGIEVSAEDAIPRARPGEEPALSFSQERLWFLDQLQPGGAAYNIPAAVRIEGRLDAGALRRSLAEIARRHEVLRTSFPERGGRPAAVVARAWEPPLPEIDLTGRASGGREERARTFAAEEARRPFDLAAGPLLRAALGRLAGDDHVLALTFHHMVFDGWSMGVFLGELAALYTAFSRGAPSPLPDLPIQFSDAARWQRARLAGGALDAERAYWRARLAGTLPILQLPADRPRPAVAGHRGGIVAGRLAASLAADLRELGRREDATIFMTLLAGFKALLARYTAQRDVLAGTPVAGRGRSELEPLIGFLANTLVIRTDLSGDPSFRDLLRRVRGATLDAYAHQEFPFDRLVEEVNPERDLSRQPLFQAMFVLQNAPQPEAALPGLTIRPIPADSGTSKFDLTFIVEEGGSGLDVAAEYDADILDAATARRLLAHYEVLLRGAAADPERRISALPLLTRRERIEISAPEAAALPAPAVEASIHGRFEAQARRTPGAPAVTFEGRTTAYAELDRRASAVARRLRELGAGPETLVALCAERSADLVAGILGILKSGAAYVPLDPAYPEERIALIVEDSKAPVVVTQEALRGRFRGLAASIVCLDDVRDLGAGFASAPTDPRSPAYVIYTSGSTGRPKGVVVTHGNVARLFDATEALFGFAASDVWTLFHSAAFDFSVWEIWGALFHGGRVVVVPYWVSRTPDAFLDLLVREEVTVLNQTPSAFLQLAQADAALSAPAPLALRLVIFGGEALDLRSLRPWVERRGDARPRLVNMYGITETTVHVTSRPIRAADLDLPRRSVVGGALPHLRVHILDGSLEPVPPGVPGEICVGGDGVARGYLGRPDLTAERFVPDPFGPLPGGRLYRSGDLARRRPDGDIEYLGRIDHQVKVRGFRIEPGEIESAIAARSDVSACAVVAREDTPGEKRLAAYVVPRPGASPPVDAIRESLRARLPDYMVPSAFVILPSLPLTAHGKIDRGALPAPAPARPEREGVHVPPRTSVETALAAIWSEVLEVGRPGIDDNYFALGGDSIRSIRVRALAGKAGIRFTLQQLFRHQTIRSLAAAAEAAEPEASGPAGPGRFALLSEEDRRRLLGDPSRLEDVEDAYPLSRLQGGMVFHSEFSPDYIVYVTSFHVRAPFDAGALQEAARAAAARHSILRTSFDLAGFSEPIQIVHRAPALAVAVEDVRGLPPDEQEALVAAWVDAEMRRPFDWTRAPLARITAHRRSDESFQLSLTEPFLDGWSVASLLTELYGTYAALLRGDAPPDRPPLRTSYRDFVALEREAIASEACRGFWARALAGASPTRLPRRAGGGREGDAPPVPRVDVPIPDDVAEGLARLASRLGVPVKSVLLAAHLKVVSVLAGRREVVTGLMVNGRPETEDGDRVLGTFLNTVPLRFDLEAGDWEGIARRAFEAEAEILPFRRYPIQEIQRVHAGESLFDTAFNFTHFYVYRRLHDLAGADVLGDYGSEQTYYALTAHFNVDSETSRITLALDYRSRDLDAGGAAAIAGYYGRALAAIAREPGSRHAEARLLPEEERRRILAAWNETGPGAPPSLLHQAFEERARIRPDAAALVEGGRSLTYRDLDRRAEALAGRLRRMGVGPEVRVGILAERSAEAVAAILGVLKAGGAYVPLDPAYPADRIRFLVEDAACGVLLAPREILGRVPAGRARVVELDGGREGSGAGPDGGAPRGALPGNAAYVIYTSGSTGRPKGVIVAHGGVANAVRHAVETFRVEPGSRVLQMASLSFDLSVLEIFTALSAGAAVVLAGRETAASGPALARFLRERRVTLMAVTPSILDAIPEEDLPDLRTVVVGGEACSAASAARWSRGRSFLNAYAPTEASIYATLHRLEAPPPHAPPVGRPIPGARAYVLDAGLEPVPEGTSGELYLAGAGVARGYLGRPDLTAERFLPDPHAGAPGARMYRTGDLARLRPDGSLEYLGRTDQQVKVRGFRIEPGEIETVLGEHPDVHEAVVEAREDAGRGRRLVAYVVPREGAPAAAGPLRAHLASRLPDYMVPSAFVFLEEMPRTRHGKVDRGALPAPGAARPDLEAAYVGPRSPVEEVVCRIAASVLGLDRVGVHDDFFHLGGHSLLATQLVSRLRDALRVEIPLRALFDAPTPAALAARAEEAARGGAAAAAPPLRPAARTGPAPLSFAQQRLWFLDRLAPGSPVFNVAATLRLRGALDVAALERALGAVVHRHEILRSTFPASGGPPAQVAAAPGATRLPVEVVPGAGLREREDRLEALAAEEAAAPFDLERGPLLRARLLRLDASDHVLLLTLHHMVTDGWSSGVLVRELGALYRAFVAGGPSPLPPLPVQYADYALWQRSWLRGEILEDQIAWWKERLAGAPPSLDLPADRPRPPAQTFAGSELAFDLTSSACEALRGLCRREGVTPFMALLAAFKTLLARYARQEDVVVGVPVAGRIRPELEGLIGFFVNTLALRTDLSGNPTFRELLARVREAALGAFAHQDLPFDQVVEAVQPRRDVSRTPIFQVMFDLQNAPAEDLDLPGLSLSLLDRTGTTSQFDLSLTMAEVEAGFSGSFQFNTDLFDPATIERLAGHFATLLDGALADPGRRILDLPILTPAEQDAFRAASTPARPRPSGDALVHRRFEERAAAAPEAPAVVCGGAALAYGELALRADRIARTLRRAGAGRGSRVGVVAAPAAETVAAVLGVLKAGAAYVPFDPAYPPGRLAATLADARVAAVLTPAARAGVLPADGPRRILLEEAVSEAAAAPAAARPAGPGPDDAAYVIYTSGSTGEPRGVEVSHRSLAASTAARDDHYTDPPERYLLLSSFAFDSSVAGIFWTLASGGTLVLLEEGPRGGLLDVPAVIARESVTHLLAIPSLYALVLREASAGSLASLRAAIVAGEACPKELVRRHHDLLPRVPLFNEYGPTEGTVWATVHRCRPDDPGSQVPIGRPVAHARVYLLDARLGPAPAGVPAEVFLGGPCVARGYIGRPDLTAERFLPDPFAGDPGSRMYRTGDLARRPPGGPIEFLGRVDHQVKVRGFRIEPGEIEEALRAHPAVRDAVVVARADEAGDRRLVAYVVSGQEPPPAAEALRDHMRGRLPEHMVPGAVAFLQAFPLTPSGKVDRAALPEPEAEPRGDGGRPPTPVEAILAEIVAEVLGRERVGVLDDFFDLGGHSLLATQVVARVREILGAEIPLRLIFEEPTVAGLAAALLETAGGGRSRIEAAARALADVAHLSDDELQAYLLAEGGAGRPEA